VEAFLIAIQGNAFGLYTLGKVPTQTAAGAHFFVCHLMVISPLEDSLF